MNKEGKNRLIRATLLYVFAAAILGGISFATPYTVGDFGSFLPYMPDSLVNVGISVVLLPILGGVTFFYIGTLLGIFFEGRLNQVLVFGFYSGGFVGITALFMILQPISQPSNYAGYLLFGGFSAFFLHNLLSAISEIRGQPYIKVISGAVLTFILGQITVQLVNLYMTQPGVPIQDDVLLIREMINWGFIAASIITLIGIFSDSKNPYLAQIGGIASNNFFIAATSLIGTLYFNFLNGRLTKVSPIIQQLSPYVEWTGIVILGALIFTIMRRGMGESIMAPTNIAPWAKHIQDQSATKGKSLQDFTEIINEFVEKGKKEKVLVKLFTFLEENRANEQEMTITLRELINYEDQKAPSLAKRGTAEKIEEENKERRIKILDITVDKINSLGLSGLTPETQDQEQVQMEKRED
jgi:hypothetical protein